MRHFPDGSFGTTMRRYLLIGFRQRKLEIIYDFRPEGFSKRSTGFSAEDETSCRVVFKMILTATSRPMTLLVETDALRDRNSEKQH
jgi:hypothetical protein